MIYLNGGAGLFLTIKETQLGSIDTNSIPSILPSGRPSIGANSASPIGMCGPEVGSPGFICTLHESTTVVDCG